MYTSGEDKIEEKIISEVFENGAEAEKRNILTALLSLRNGNFSARLPVEWTGINGKIANTFNEVMETNERMAQEFERVGWVVGHKEKIAKEANASTPKGEWAESIQSVKTFTGDLVHSTKETSRAIGAVVKRALSQSMSLEAECRPVNKMMSQQGFFLASINTNEIHVSHGHSLGAVDYVSNPIEPEILRAKVVVFTDLFRKREQIRHHSELLRQAAEKRAEELETRLHMLLNQLNVGVFKATTDGELLEANPAFRKFFELDEAERLRQFNLKSSWKELGTLSSSGATGEIRDLRWQYDDGRIAWFKVSLLQSVETAGSRVIEGLVENITPRKQGEELLKNLNETLEKRVKERSEALRQSQEHLRRSERLSSLGTLAAGIAHEINNPLNSILMASEYAQKNLDSTTVLGTSLGVISENTRRCGRIIKGVLQFARNQKTLKAECELNAIVRAAFDLMRTYIKTPIEIQLELTEEAVPVFVNQTEIEQVVINIMQNAADAAEGNAAISIKTSRNGNHAELSIKDNGPGIPEAIIDKIFDPFFSTKVNRGGTGLGLSVAHGIIGEHGATLGVSSSPGNGVHFLIRIPLSSVIATTNIPANES